MFSKNLFSSPFRSIIDRSRLLAPARQILEEGDHWTDYACAAFYLALLFALLYGLAVTLTTEFILAVGALAVTVILARVIYLTPGVFCPGATSGCLRACLGHTSGRMQMPTHAAARDRRTAHYIENPSLFIARLKLELAEHCQEAARLNLRPAVRLNGTSDLPWEDLHSELFNDFPQLHFFDYTKVVSRMEHFMGCLPDGRAWPEKYYLTFSATPNNHEQARRVLDQGQNVAVVFWTEVPSSHWGFPAIDGDTHDARFLDPEGVIVGLKAKGLAQVDLSGFTIRPCPNCGPSAPELRLRFAFQNTHRTTVHECPRCGFELRQRHALPQAVQKCSREAVSRRSPIGGCQGRAGGPRLGVGFRSRSDDHGPAAEVVGDHRRIHAGMLGAGGGSQHHGG